MMYQCEVCGMHFGNSKDCLDHECQEHFPNLMKMELSWDGKEWELVSDYHDLQPGEHVGVVWKADVFPGTWVWTTLCNSDKKSMEDALLRLKRVAKLEIESAGRLLPEVMLDDENE